MRTTATHIKKSRRENQLKTLNNLQSIVRKTKGGIVPGAGHSRRTPFCSGAAGRKKDRRIRARKTSYPAPTPKKETTLPGQNASRTQNVKWNWRLQELSESGIVNIPRTGQAQT